MEIVRTYEGTQNDPDLTSEHVIRRNLTPALASRDETTHITNYVRLMLTH